MAGKIYLRTNAEIRMSQQQNVTNDNCVNTGGSTDSQHTQMPSYGQTIQLQPRMILEGADAKKIWEYEDNCHSK